MELLSHSGSVKDLVWKGNASGSRLATRATYIPHIWTFTPRLKTPLINSDGEVYRNAASTTSFPSMEMIMNSQSGLASDQWDRKGTAKSSECTRSGEMEEA